MGRLLESGRDVRALAGARLCAVGPGTAARLNRSASGSTWCRPNTTARRW